MRPLHPQHHQDRSTKIHVVFVVLPYSAFSSASRQPSINGIIIFSPSLCQENRVHDSCELRVHLVYRHVDSRRSLCAILASAARRVLTAGGHFFENRPVRSLMSASEYLFKVHLER